jgi:hypothetical protein
MAVMRSGPSPALHISSLARRLTLILLTPP